jgi:cytochrome d ubiquinol oxidase subunit II
VAFLPYLVQLLLMTGLSEDPLTGHITPEPFKYWHNLLAMPWAFALLLIGVVLVLYGIGRSLFQIKFTSGFWFSSGGTVLVVMVLLLLAGYTHTAYYPSLIERSSSLTIANSSSSLTTLKAMSIVSLFIPFVIAYITYVWRALDKK